MAAQGKYQAPAANALLDVLEFMAERPGYWGPTELARQLNLSGNMIFRTLMVLSERGYLRRNAAGQYELNLRLFALGSHLRKRFDLRRLARPHLEALAEFTLESCQLQIPDGRRMLLVDAAAPPAQYYLAAVPGSRFYFQGNAFGKAVMAFMDADELQALAADPEWRAITPATRLDLDELTGEFDAIRAGGCARECDEYYTGGHCVACPVFDADGEAAGAIGLSGLQSRRDPARDAEIERAIFEHARRLSHACGYSGGHFKAA